MGAEEIAALRRENPNGRADKISGQADAGLKDVNNRRRQKHPSQNESREVALDLIGLAHERDRSADGSDVQDRRALAPRRRFISARQNESAERLTQNQRRESDSASDRPAEKIPVVRDQQNNARADEQRSQDR